MRPAASYNQYTGSVLDGKTAGLVQWLIDVVPALIQPLDLTLVAGGRSNFTYVATDARGRRVVVRRPPPGALEHSAHDVAREASILAALEPTPVPVPRVLAVSAAADAIGVPVVAMEFVDGHTLADPADTFWLAPRARGWIGDAMIEVLAQLHALDVDEIGLGGLRRPSGLVERQLRRWRKQLDRRGQITARALLDLHEVLERRLPPPQRTSLVHGDYKLANLRVRDDGAVLSVLDWELAAIGDPLLDLGWLLASWGRPDDTRAWISQPPTTAAGFSDPGALAWKYSELTGLVLDDLAYYVAFAYWRCSCINEGILHRIESGAMNAKAIDVDLVRSQIRWQTAAAATLLDGARQLSDAQTALKRAGI